MPFLGQSFNRQEGQASTLLCEQEKLLNSFLSFSCSILVGGPQLQKYQTVVVFFNYFFSTLWGTDRSQILSPYEVRQTPPTFFRRLPPRGGGTTRNFRATNNLRYGQFICARITFFIHLQMTVSLQQFCFGTSTALPWRPEVVLLTSSEKSKEQSAEQQLIFDYRDTCLFSFLHVSHCSRQPEVLVGTEHPEYRLPFSSYDI